MAKERVSDQVEVPEKCPSGHDWTVPRAYTSQRTSRWILFTCAYVVGDYPRTTCGSWSRRLVGPKLRGFMSDPTNTSAVYETKVKVFRALLELQGEGLEPIPVSIRGKTDLSSGQVSGVLSKGCKYGFLRRDPDRIQLVPRGFSYRYRLTGRGLAFLDWAASQSL